MLGTEMNGGNPQVLSSRPGVHISRTFDRSMVTNLLCFAIMGVNLARRVIRLCVSRLRNYMQQRAGQRAVNALVSVTPVPGLSSSRRASG